jgi:preprotein translocase subunit SecE
MNNVTELFNASWHEITKEVTWPKMSELNASTTLVLVASLVFALLVGAIDFSFENALNLFYSSF